MSTKFLAGVLLLIVTAALGVLIYQSLNSGGSKLSDLSYVGQTPPDVVIIDETVYTRADNLAWIRDFDSGYQGDVGKGNSSISVRAVRAF